MHSNFIPLGCTLEYAENFVNGRMIGGNGQPFNNPVYLLTLAFKTEDRTDPDNWGPDDEDYDD